MYGQPGKSINPFPEIVLSVNNDYDYENQRDNKAGNNFLGIVFQLSGYRSGIIV